MQAWMAIVCLYVSPVVSVAAGDSDPVLEFYWNKAAQASKALVSDSAGLRYRIRALTFYHRLDRHGLIVSTDSLLADYHFSSGTLDSVEVIEGSDDKTTRADFSVLDIFSRPYITRLFPNDTGGAELAIGFDSDSAHPSDPTGLILIDRYRYYPLTLYTHYPDSGGYKRYSRSYRFAIQDGLLYTDSIWVHAARQGIFSIEYYRQETGVLSLTPVR